MMTPIETWIYENLLELVMLLGAGVIAFVKLSRFHVEVNEKLDETCAALREHLEDDSPHPSCEVEKERAANIIKRLDSIDQKIGLMDQRIFEIWQNGRK